MIKIVVKEKSTVTTACERESKKNRKRIAGRSWNKVTAACEKIIKNLALVVKQNESEGNCGTKIEIKTVFFSLKVIEDDFFL